MVSIFPWPCWFTECTRNDWNWNIYFALNWSPASWKIATSPNHNSSKCRPNNWKRSKVKENTEFDFLPSQKNEVSICYKLDIGKTTQKLEVKTPENSTFQGGCHINRSWCCSTSTTCNILVRWSIFHHQWVGLTTSIQKWKSQKTLLITWDRNHNKYLPQVEFDCSWSLVYNFHALIPHLAGEFRI